jgi:zinc transporter ZupT
MDSILLALFWTDIAGAAVGMYAMRSRTVSDKFKAISAGIMVGVALFWIFPDLMQKSGTVHAALIVAVGLAHCAVSTGLFIRSARAVRITTSARASEIAGAQAAH